MLGAVLCRPTRKTAPSACVTRLMFWKSPKLTSCPRQATTSSANHVVDSPNPWASSTVRDK